jgi:TRAP-type uncharacterized transport system substrate-binding protein
MTGARIASVTKKAAAVPRRAALCAAAALLARPARAQPAVDLARPVNLALGSVSASSSVYAFAVALAAAVRRHDPALTVTNVEGGGGFDHARLMRNRVLDFSVSGSPAVANAVRTGTGAFQRDGAWDGIRLMFMRNVNVTRLYVRADAARQHAIRSFGDLRGHRVGPGVPGTRDMQRVVNANQVFNVGALMTPASLDDTANQLRTGRIVAMGKGSPHDRFDAAMLALHFQTPLTVIGFTPEQAAELQRRDPLDTFIETPRGGIRELPEAGPLLELSSSVMVMASTNMPADVGYRVMRAARLGWAAINEAFPPTQGLDPILDAFRQTPEIEGLHFHAGVVRFAREQGIPVPPRLVPPEYDGPR